MTGGTGRWGRLWVLATLASIALHGGALAALVWRPDWHMAPAPPPPGELRLDVTSIAADSVDASTQVMTSVADLSEGLPDPAMDQTLTPMADNPLPTLAEGSPILSPLNDAISIASSTAPAAPPGPGADPTTEGGPDAEASTATAEDLPPPDPRIAELFARIRAQLAQTCLFARPALLGTDQVQLSVFATDDRQISALMQDLTKGLDTPVTEQNVLLDPRQCPALGFARRDPAYPLPGLSLQLDDQDIASGANLSGRVSGGAGFYTTLLLIDDEGVVHDLRRFLIGSSAGSRFDIPLARFGVARDTHQLILALATPVRPDSVTRLAGSAAEAFFDGLGAETGQDLRVGLASIYVR
ncbi:hypothetical protein [Paracoccus sp. Ld10]|uniref:hypothetical protein n=1 Tax=Paracoccus sp. Ld10 TaxID=649158 RepID=UPI00386442CB